MVSDSLFYVCKAAKAALINFYETLRFELKDEVGVTIATHGWIGSEMTRGKFMLEEGAEMQWKEEREVSPFFMVVSFVWKNTFFLYIHKNVGYLKCTML